MKTDWEFRGLSDEELEILMQSGASSLPPDDNLVAEITPWRKAINRALTGFALNMVTLNFLGLDYLLPAIGTLLLLLGFRALRQENKGFRLCWHLAILQAIIRYGTLIINATVWQVEICQTPAMEWAAYFLPALTFIQILGLRAGFRNVRSKNDLDPAAPGTTVLAVWYVVLYILAVFSYTGWLLTIPLIIAYIVILRTLWKLPRQLEEAGYALQPAPVRLSDQALSITVCIVLTIGIAAGYLFFSRYNMDWQEVSPAEQTELEDLRTELLELGFPEIVLNDLSIEDLATCEGGIRVVTNQHDCHVNDGRQIVRREGNHTSYSRVYDVNELRIIGVAVELPGERECWRIFHHFEWIIDPGFYGTEAMQFWPAYHLTEGWSKGSEATGRVLYDRDGQTYTAPYYSLGEMTFQQNSLFFGDQQRTDLFAAFSFPAHGKRQRGYVTYDTLECADGWIIDSWINYVHQCSWLQYPVQTAMENRMHGSWNISGPFRTVQDALQFYPFDDPIEIIN